MDDLHDRMMNLARDLGSAPHPRDLLQRIVDTAKEHVDSCEHAGISLASRRGTIKSSVATSDMPTRADQLQQEHGEGPCVDAVWEEFTVHSRDLERDERWPRWAPALVEETGVRSVLCVRLFTGKDRLGALNLFSTRAGAFERADLDEVEAIAAHGAVALAAAESIENLTWALSTRTLIGQATGLLMDRYELTDTNAFELLKRYSNDQNRKMSVIAQELVDEHNKRHRRAANRHPSR